MRCTRGGERRLPTRVDVGGDAGGRDARSRRMFRLSVGTIVLVLASLSCAASALASGAPQGPPAGPTTPPFTQCPAIGKDTSCGYLIDVTGHEKAIIRQDPSQGAYDEGGDDVTVAVQNDSNAAIDSLHIGAAGSDDDSFGFDGDGMCSESEEFALQPEGCPFGPNAQDPYDYWGPDAELDAEPESSEAGSVVFPIPLQPGEYTFFTLEAPPDSIIVAGEVNDTVSTELTNTETIESGPNLKAPTPVNFTDTARIGGPEAFTAEGKVTYRVYSDPQCTAEIPGSASTKPVVAGEAAPSNPVGKTLTTNARYYWQASYTGFGMLKENVSTCGSETMSFGTPPELGQASVVTVLSGGGQTGASITVPVETPVTDTAAVIAPGGQPTTGRLSYAAYTTSNCAARTQVASVGGGGFTTGSGPSSNAAKLPVGTYYFRAFYSGNAVLAPTHSECGSEVLTVVVAPAPDTLTTSQAVGTATGPSLSITAGTVGETDHAIISGTNAAGATGTVTYALYSASSCAANTKVFNGGTSAVTAGVAGPSAAVSSALAPGKYYWLAAYSGDTRNAPSVSACGSEVLTVVPAVSIPGSASTTGTTVTITVKCPSSEPCVVTVTVTGIEVTISFKASVSRKKIVHKRIVTLATGKFTIPGLGSKKLSLHLTKAGKRLLARDHGHVKATVRISDKTPGGEQTTARTVAISPAKIKHKK